MLQAPGWESESPSFALFTESDVVLGWSPPHTRWIWEGVAEGRPGESTGFGMKGTGLHLGSITY